MPDDTKIEASWILPGGIGAGTTPEIAIVWWYTETVTATMIGNCGIFQVTAHALDPTNIVTRGLVSVSDSCAVRKIAGPVGSIEEISAENQNKRTAHLVVRSNVFPQASEMLKIQDDRLTIQREAAHHIRRIAISLAQVDQ